MATRGKALDALLEGDRGRPEVAALPCSRRGPCHCVAVHTGSAVSQQHPQPGGAKLADKLPSARVRDCLLDDVALEPFGNGLLDRNLRR